MIGIISFSVHVPLWRLARGTIVEGMRGEKAVANFDEDSITMSVAAALGSLDRVDREAIDGLFFASTTSPYKEKQASTTVAAAIDLRRDVRTADFTNSLKSGTTAVRFAVDTIKAGSAKKVMVTAADCRLGLPGSAFEQNLGDGAASLLIGDSDVAVEIEDSYSISNEMIDVWRADDDTFVRSWEGRFVIAEGYNKIMRETVSGMLKKCGLAPKDFARVVFYSPDARSAAGLAKSLGFDPKSQLQENFFDSIGNTGTPYSLMLLVAALEGAKPGDRILLASYGNGGDAFVFKATEKLEKIKNRNVMRQQIESKKTIPDYKTYLKWRGLLPVAPLHSRPMGSVSAPAWMRERSAIISFHGSKCNACGTIQYPPQRICTKCQAKDQSEEIRLSDKKGKVFSFSADYVTSLVDLPLVFAVINFEGGGRFLTTVTDKDLKDMKSGMEIEMTFRKLFDAEGVHNYFWKVMPPR